MSGIIEIKWKQKFTVQDEQENLFVSSVLHTHSAWRTDSLHPRQSEVLKTQTDHVFSYLEPFWGFQEKPLVIIYMFLYCPSYFFSLILQQTSLVCLSFIPTGICLFPPICHNFLYHRTITHAVPFTWNVFLNYFEKLIPIYPWSNLSNPSLQRCPCRLWPVPLSKYFLPLFQHTFRSWKLICGITRLPPSPLFAKLYSTGASGFDWVFHLQGLVKYLSHHRPPINIFFFEGRKRREGRKKKINIYKGTQNSSLPGAA